MVFEAAPESAGKVGSWVSGDPEQAQASAATDPVQEGVTELYNAVLKEPLPDRLTDTIENLGDEDEEPRS
ncbi:MAG: hypothetical protein PW790_04215 [Parvibaculaceae bacterium]|nr:hypothetical protein [Parvibaculaceae bacterium]